LFSESTLPALVEIRRRAKNRIISASFEGRAGCLADQLIPTMGFDLKDEL
jgi:hypothetical protein